MGKGSVPPLIIARLNTLLPQEQRQKTMDTIAKGIEQGALIIGPEIEIIAFDNKGRLVYPYLGRKTP